MIMWAILTWAVFHFLPLMSSLRLGLAEALMADLVGEVGATPALKGEKEGSRWAGGTTAWCWPLEVYKCILID